MKEYNLMLIGLRTVLRTPYEITISENLQPFLSCRHEKYDCIIELHKVSVLPEFSENGVWHGLEYYDCQEGRMRVFHSNSPKSAPFSMTQIYENGNVEVSVLEEYLSYFSGTAGIFNRIGMETLLLQNRGLLLHSSLVKYGENAIIFSGPSGVGKSTQADIWREYLGAEVLNGDRAALRKENGVWNAYGSPYAGTSEIYKNDFAPLKAVVILRQARENRFTRLTDGEAFRYIYPEISIHHWQKEFVSKATDICLEMLADIPVYMLECLPEKDAALLVKKGLGL